jgi:thiol-disulfide isomerase/thioredoxin
MSNQLIWLLALLGLSTLFGLYRKRTDGRIKLSRAIDNKKQAQMQDKTPDEHQAPSSGIQPSEIPTATPTPTVPTQGAPTQGAPTQGVPTRAVSSKGLSDNTHELKFGQALGAEVTLVQFSSAFCQPCRATRLLLEDVAASTSGVAHIEIDAEAHLDLVREMGVTRTPTTFILNRDGDVVGKSVGLPKRLEVMNVVEAVRSSA